MSMGLNPSLFQAAGPDDAEGARPYRHQHDELDDLGQRQLQHNLHARADTILPSAAVDGHFEGLPNFSDR